MRPSMTQLLYWAPRVLGIALGLFVGLFALDVFSEGRPLKETLVTFLIHLLPAAMVFAAVAIAWRWELAGATLFLALAVTYWAMTGGRQPWSAYALLSGLPTGLGVLFLGDWLYRAKRKAHA